MTGTVLALALGILQREEGLRLDPYQCTQGKWTCWYGRNYQDNPLTLSETTQLLRMGNTPSFASWLLENDVDRLDKALTLQPWYARQDKARKAALLSMAYQFGVRRLLKFQDTIGALSSGDYERASREMLNSLWAREQTPARAKRMADIIRTGEIPA